MAKRAGATRATRAGRNSKPMGKTDREADVSLLTRDVPRGELKRARAESLSNEMIEMCLATGDRAEMLENYLGPELYHELRELKKQEGTRSVRASGKRVLIIPGIEGSKLGSKGLIFDDVVWFDPIDTMQGRLRELVMEPASKIRHTSTGVFLFAYLKMKLCLRLAGFNADFWHYDWRYPIEELGRRLADDLKKYKPGEVTIVCHSMGGLVTRAAAKLDGSRIERAIMLGTPNHGSFMTIPSMRGVSSLVKLIGYFDFTKSGVDLADKVFNTMPAVYQLMPDPAMYTTVNLYDAKNWPNQKAGLRQPLLDRAAKLQACLAATDARFTLIAGVGQETIVDARIKKHEKDPAKTDFEFDLSKDGDGVVPLKFAMTGNVKTYYVEEGHGSLANNGDVIDAVKELIDTGKTEVLPDTYAGARSLTRRVLGSELAPDRAPFDTRSPDSVTPAQRLRALSSFVSPDSAKPRKAVKGTPQSLPPGAHEPFSKGVVVSRRRQHRIDVILAKGSITDVKSKAYVLGTFEGVRPSGPAAVVDRELDGAITEFTRRRMYSSYVGELFIIPTGFNKIPADLVVLTGMGPFDLFDGEVQRTVAENVIRSFVKTGVDNFATVVFGGGSGQHIGQSLRNLMTGFVQGLLDADKHHRFRSVYLCETNDEKYQLLREELYRLAGTDLFNEVAVTIDEEILPPPAPSAAPTRGAWGPRPVFLSARMRWVDGVGHEIRTSLLGDIKATTVTGIRSISSADLDAIVSFPESQGLRPLNVETLGKNIREKILAPQVAELLAMHKENPVVVVVDAESSRVPWEALNLNADTRFALSGGMSRTYEADNLSVAKFLHERPIGERLEVLLVVNPTEDLPGAKIEGDHVYAMLRDNPAYVVKRLEGPQATRATILSELRAGRYDVIHYAGHAFFDPRNRSAGGLLCAKHEVLTGADLSTLPGLPAMVFLNACQSGRIRSGTAQFRSLVNTRSEADKRAVTETNENRSKLLLTQGISVAEALLRGGVASVLGTYWPVQDSSAKSFAQEFYLHLAQGATIGSAVLHARKIVEKLPSATDRLDWADYMLYGDPSFALRAS